MYLSFLFWNTNLTACQQTKYDFVHLPTVSNKQVKVSVSQTAIKYFFSPNLWNDELHEFKSQASIQHLSFLAHYHCKTLHINTWPLMCFIRDHDSCNYCCYFISVTDTIMKHNYLAVRVALLISASLHTVMLMPLINCHKTDDFSLLIVPVSFVKLPDFEARTLRPYLINPTWAMLVFLCDYKRDGRCSREIQRDLMIIRMYFT